MPKAVKTLGQDGEPWVTITYEDGEETIAIEQAFLDVGPVSPERWERMNTGILEFRQWCRAQRPGEATLELEKPEKQGLTQSDFLSNNINFILEHLNKTQWIRRPNWLLRKFGVKWIIRDEVA